MMISNFFVSTLLGFTLAQATEKYARPELLIEAEELAKPAVLKSVRVVDARGNEKYKQGHIPGAVPVDAEAWSKAFYAKQDPAEWEKKIGELGIGYATNVVIYDDSKAKDAARVWFILNYWGFKNVQLLNGGWSSWKDREVSTTLTTPKVATFMIHKPRKNFHATQESVSAAIQKKTQILDVRSEGEYCGDDKLKNKRAGHVPGAIHLEWTEVLDPKTHRFKSPDALAKLFKNAGIDLTRSTVTHCQSGGRASVMTFALELMGADEVSNYYRGWSEWGNSSNPIEASPRKR